MARKSVTKRQQRKGSRRMRGGMTTGEHAIAVFGDSNSQVAVGSGSNVIKMTDPTVVVAPMRGGRKMKGGDIFEDAKNWLSGAENKPAAEEAEPVVEEVAQVEEAAPAEEAAVAMTETAPVAEEEEVAQPMPVIGGKKKSAKKHRKSHKKDKASKKRMRKHH